MPYSQLLFCLHKICIHIFSYTYTLRFTNLSMHRTENEVYPIVSLIYGGVPVAKSSPQGPLPPGPMLAYMAKIPTPLKNIPI